MLGRLIIDILGGVKSQAVEVEFCNPVTGISKKELTHWPGILAIEVERLSPLSGVTVSEIIVGKLLEIIAIRPYMVVDYIENDANSQSMSPINKTAEIVWLAIESRRCEEIYTVIAPTKTSGKLRYRHDFQYRDAGLSQLWQFTHRTDPCTFARERADVHLIDNLPFQFDALPCPISPAEFPSVDDLRRAMWTIGLEARGGIRIQGVAAIEPKAIACTISCSRDSAREIARGFRGQLDPLGTAGAVPRSSFDHDLYPPAARHPHAEMYTTF